jgi:hypothetical protein
VAIRYSFALSGDVPSPSSGGDELTANVENQLIANGTNGGNYYLYLRDWTSNWICSHHYSTTSFTPFYADYIAERTANGTIGSPARPTAFSLPDFSTFDFTLCQMAISSTIGGSYSNYNNGFGFGVQMKNGTQETTTFGMTDVASGYGQFDESWNSSAGT